jgi:predicted nucleotidyltransferase
MANLRTALDLLKPALRSELEKARTFFESKTRVRAVWLFGSASKNRAMDWRSDLDFAVAGLQPGEEYETWALLDECLAHPVDLVRMEDANPLLKMEILKGILLYEN